MFCRKHLSIDHILAFKIIYIIFFALKVWRIKQGSLKSEKTKSEKSFELRCKRVQKDENSLG